ncbi:MAG: helix-turn-helix transcriptional regulator [Roseivirga sp.]|uniref:helix-turn-helix domain-containing protein n=1 Tax=Roseivirga sp. TaxID=1964215 RepID=UPI001B231BA0|nr:helix-turn-helix transcriptional regulator [Roseivirga sp.]MBO6496440.1 helix-turn-helix transcriptional regulator [Roseivirga sp.]
MQTEKHKMIASVVKEKRTDLNYTQQELADLCKVSLRSIQRIENGEVYPRQYTLNELAKNLNFSLDILSSKEKPAEPNIKGNLAKKRIISLAFVVGTILLTAAFLAQSSQFPETSFELYLFYTGILIVLSLGLLFLWRKKQ